MKRKKTSLNLILLISTLVAGSIAWLIGNAIYEANVNLMWRPLLIGIIFLCLYVILTVTVVIVGAIRGTFTDDILFSDGPSKIILSLIIGAVIVFLLAILFQWLYGLCFTSEAREPSSYVFVIDDSGSMEDSDPDLLRYSAIYDILDEMPSNFNYMIYGFSDNVSLVRNMAPASEGTGNIPSYSSGRTSIKAALQQVIGDYNNNRWSGGASPKVILLTDGYATDINFLSRINRTLNEYANSKISISTVGLGNVDVSLMKKIARSTGGVFIDVSDASQLREAMSTAIVRSSSNDLLSERYSTKLGFLYALLHIVFVFLLGSAIGGFVIVAYAQKNSMQIMGVTTPIKSLIGALLIETGVNMLGIYSKLAWFILWLLIALTVAAIEKNIRSAPPTVKRPPQKLPRGYRPVSRNIKN